MSKKLMAWEEMWEKLKASDPNTKVTFEMAEKVCKLYNSVEHKIIEDLQHHLDVAEKAFDNLLSDNEIIIELQKQLEEKTKTIVGLIEEQKNIENSASYQMFLDIQKQLEEKEKLLQYGTTEIKKLQKRISDIVERDEKLFKSQPAEIVEKIKKQLIKRLNTIAGYGKMTTDELSFFIENEFGSDLDTILKEYQK